MKYMTQFVHGKTTRLFNYSENLKHYEKRLQQKIFLFRSSRSQIFIKNKSLGISESSSQAACLDIITKTSK